jgi:hypothetical protein
LWLVWMFGGWNEERYLIESNRIESSCREYDREDVAESSLMLCELMPMKSVQCCPSLYTSSSADNLLKLNSNLRDLNPHQFQNTFVPSNHTSPSVIPHRRASSATHKPPVAQRTQLRNPLAYAHLLRGFTATVPGSRGWNVKMECDLLVGGMWKGGRERLVKLVGIWL